jgi:predicted membrane-bound mannosyltransferase
VTVLCAAAGAWLALRRRDAFGAFCALWAAGELAAYSLLRYKTPWLGLNILLPAVLAAGVLGREISAWRAPAVPRTALVCTLLVGLGWEAWRAVEVSFVRFDDTRLALVYVPTHRDVDALVAEVRAAARRIPPGSTPAIRIMGRYAWPLPWYFRRLPGMKYSHVIPPHPDGDVLIVERAWEGRLRPLLRQRYQRREYLLRPGEPVVVYVNERLGKARQIPGL